MKIIDIFIVAYILTLDGSKAVMMKDPFHGWFNAEQTIVIGV